LYKNLYKFRAKTFYCSGPPSAMFRRAPAIFVFVTITDLLFYGNYLSTLNPTLLLSHPGLGPDQRCHTYVTKFVLFTLYILCEQPGL